MVSRIKNIIFGFKYILFNKRYFKNNENVNNGIILVELFNYKASIISLSLFINAFCSLYKTSIVGFEPLNFSFKKKIKFFINKLNILHFYKFYKSFGVKKIIVPKVKENKVALSITKQIIKKINSKKKILDIKIKNIKIGDLIYDSYLRDNRLPTINYKSKIFEKYIENVVKIFLYWYEYFEKENVKALVISHSVYTLAIPARIALKKKIKVYNIGAASCYKLSKDKPLRWSNFDSYKKFFKSLNKTQQKKAIEIAKKNLTQRLKGENDILYERGFNMPHVFREKKEIKNIFKTKKRKVIIAAHSFHDAPHVHGEMIFPDFSDWINYLGKKSKKIKKYEWCIKLHPSDFEENHKFIKDIARKYKSLTFLPKDSSHIQILKENVVAVLTVYGSIGHEYPLFNIPVINAGYGPHFHYNFNYNPKTLKQYNTLINNLEKLKVNKKDIVDIYKFYFSHYLIDYEIFNRLPKTDFHLDSSNLFNYFINSFKSREKKKIREDFTNFIISNKRRMIKVSL